MKKRLVLAILCLMFLFIGCSKQEAQNLKKQSLDSKQVVENYFEYYNEKNKEGLLTTLTERHKSLNIDWGFENLESKKLIEIHEDTNEDIRKGYLINGMGFVNRTKEYDLIVYKVKYEVKYKSDGVGPQDSGTYEGHIFVIRNDGKSPWLIDDIGE